MKVLLLFMALIVIKPPVALALSGSQVYERVKDSVVVVGAFDRAGKASWPIAASGPGSRLIPHLPGLPLARLTETWAAIGRK